MGDIKKIVIKSLQGQLEYGLEDTEAREDVQQIVEGAPEAFDTFKEIAEYIAKDGATAAEIIKSVKDNADAIANETIRAKEAEQANATAIANETTRAKAAEQANATAIANETTRAKEAEQANATAITNEVNRAKAAEQANATAIEEVEKKALRRLFIAAGAEYNDSGADKTKTAPWGETVTHKAGCYYLNGLGDITEAQMMAIYNAPHNALYPFAYAHLYNTRTLLWRNGTKTSIPCKISHDGIFFYNTQLESVGSGISNDALYYASPAGELNGYFRLCSQLKHINIMLQLAYVQKLNRMFDGCTALVTVYLNKLPCDVSLADSPAIGKDSILHAISNAQPASAITITLHPDAYARLADDADIVAALESQPLVSLVSA